MPYAEPTSPIPSPVKEFTPTKGLATPPSLVEDEAGPSTSKATFDNVFTASGPMPGIPRRGSTHSGSSTPRRMLSPAVSRQSSGSYQFPSSRPMEGLPRRLSSGQHTIYSNLPSGLPTESSSLGLKLHPSPVKSMREPKDSLSSVSTVDSSLPPTPADEPRDLPPPEIKEFSPSVPFPPYEPPPKTAMPARSAMSPPRPTLLNSRRSSLTGRHSLTGSLQIPFPSHASASNLPETPSPTPFRPSNSMIRKKSGEVVKPSLKQRSMSTPDLTRQNGGSSPDTPEHERNRGFPEERSKSVRFAGADDDDPRALESVVLFLREQKVTAVSKAADGNFEETETENDTDASDFVQFRTRRNAAAKAADEDRVVMEGGSRVPRIRVDFSPDSRGHLKEEYVVLERVELQDDMGQFGLKGSAIVRNISFQKWVGIRFTLDHWQTVSEVSGTHVTHIPSATTGDEGWDRFSFLIKLEDYKRKLDERQLVMCIRFSVDGREWWDSNDGLNYNFTFKKAPKRPPRASLPAAFGNGFMRLTDETATTLPGLRQNRSVSPSTQISRAFGADTTRASGPRNWIFPKLAAHLDDGPPRSDSPQPSGPPPSSFHPPSVPDVHTHLSLSKYCAPSPPLSPPKETDGISISGPPIPLVLSPQTEQPTPAMNVFGGQFATLSPPESTHERRSSWDGIRTESWDSFARGVSDNETTPHATDGEATPVANGSRSPTVDRFSSDSSPESKPLTMKRSTGDLRALIEQDDLPSTSSSTLSSPPTPIDTSLPLEPMSPSPSLTSTGESSPINTISSDSTPDLSAFPLTIDPDEQRGRSGFDDNSHLRTLDQMSYQEFIKRFCFFQSPVATPNEDPVFRRPAYIPLSGAQSPNGFPFFTGSSNSPRSTPTPTRQYDSASDAFHFPSVPMPVPPRKEHRSGSDVTPKASPPTLGADSIMASLSGAVSPAHSRNGSNHSSAGPSSGRGSISIPSTVLSPNEHPWSSEPHHKHSPSLTAAK